MRSPTRFFSSIKGARLTDSKKRWNSSLCTCTGRTRYCANWTNRSRVKRAVACPDFGSLLTRWSWFSVGNYNQIYPTSQKYIHLRRALAGQVLQDPNANGVVKEPSPPPEPEIKPASDAGGDTNSSRESPETHTGKHSRFAFLLDAVPFIPCRHRAPHRPSTAHQPRAPKTSRLVDGRGRTWISRKGRPRTSSVRFGT